MRPEPSGYLFIGDSDAPTPRNEVHERAFTDVFSAAWVAVGEVERLDVDGDILRFDLVSFTTGKLIPMNDLMHWTSLAVESKDKTFRLIAREVQRADSEPFRRYTRDAWPFEYLLRRETPRYEMWSAAPPVH